MAAKQAWLIIAIAYCAATNLHAEGALRKLQQGYPHGAAHAEALPIYARRLMKQPRKELLSSGGVPTLQAVKQSLTPISTEPRTRSVTSAAVAGGAATNPAVGTSAESSAVPDPVAAFATAASTAFNLIVKSRIDIAAAAAAVREAVEIKASGNIAAIIGANDAAQQWVSKALDSATLAKDATDIAAASLSTGQQDTQGPGTTAFPLVKAAEVGLYAAQDLNRATSRLSASGEAKLRVAATLALAAAEEAAEEVAEGRDEGRIKALAEETREGLRFASGDDYLVSTALKWAAAVTTGGNGRTITRPEAIAQLADSFTEQGHRQIGSETDLANKWLGAAAEAQRDLRVVEAQAEGVMDAANTAPNKDLTAAATETLDGEGKEEEVAQPEEPSLAWESEDARLNDQSMEAPGEGGWYFEEAVEGDYWAEGAWFEAYESGWNDSPTSYLYD